MADSIKLIECPRDAWQGLQGQIPTYIKTDYLKALGADSVLLRQEIDFGSRPLEAARFAGAIDNVGGEMLTWLTRSVDLWGNIASIGLAEAAGVVEHRLEYWRELAR